MLLAVPVVWSISWRRQVHRARQWLADPPGPPREAPTQRPIDRWLTPRRLVPVTLAVVTVAVLAGFGIALLSR